MKEFENTSKLLAISIACAKLKTQLEVLNGIDILCGADRDAQDIKYLQAFAEKTESILKIKQGGDL